MPGHNLTDGPLLSEVRLYIHFLGDLHLVSASCIMQIAKHLSICIMKLGSYAIFMQQVA
jgi:hypothetical protein